MMMRRRRRSYAVLRCGLLAVGWLLLCGRAPSRGGGPSRAATSARGGDGKPAAPACRAPDPPAGARGAGRAEAGPGVRSELRCAGIWHGQHMHMDMVMHMHVHMLEPRLSPIPSPECSEQEGEAIHRAAAVEGWRRLTT